jgi:hypothetical protein
MRAADAAAANAIEFPRLQTQHLNHMTAIDNCGSPHCDLLLQS